MLSCNYTFSKKINGILTNKLFRVLFDTGSDKTFVNLRVLPNGISCTRVKPISVRTMHTTSKLDRQVLLQHITLPEFSPTQRIDKPLSAYVFDKTNSPYDLIMGLDVLVPLGIDISCSTQRVTWMQAVIPFRPRSYFDDSLLQDPIAHSSHCLAVDQFDNPVDLFNSAVVTPLLSLKYK